jgi:hypothetical protein
MLKADADYFRQIWDRRKTFECRLNDRDFRRGDQLVLHEVRGRRFTGREISVVVSYILHGGHFGVKRGYCVMALAEHTMTRAHRGRQDIGRSRRRAQATTQEPQR